ncbi:MAG: AIR synthase-related protein, partial [Endomicrobiia bacterium]
VRKIFTEQEQKKYAEILLAPTKIYVKTILQLLKNFSPNKDIKAMVHITGGGFYDNIVRVLGQEYNAVVYKNSWVVSEIFKVIQNKGEISDKEMYRTFNMGIGMILVVNKNKVKEVLKFLGSEGSVIGEIIKNDKKISEVILL